LGFAYLGTCTLPKYKENIKLGIVQGTHGLNDRLPSGSRFFCGILRQSGGKIMGIGEAIGIAGGALGLGTALWRVFRVVANLELKIEKLENEIEVQELTINGTRERLEHTNKRTADAAKTVYLRVNRIEDWLNKNTAYQPSTDR
jgi:hypothetical protein